jgi:hypothetical protein
MSNLPPDEIEAVEATVEPVPVGLPKALAVLSSAELAAKLREWRNPTEEPKDAPAILSEQPSSDG